MAGRRSSRPKKALKYSALDELSDDDFADSTPPPPKKSKVGKSTDKKDATSSKNKEISLGQTVADVYESDSCRKRRVPVTDKIYERELQQALEMSLLQSQGSQDSVTKENKESTNLAQLNETKAKDESAGPTVKKVPGVVVEENIELIEDKEDSSGHAGRGSSRRCREKQENQKVATAKGKLRLESDDDDGDGDDDYASDVEDDSDDSIVDEESDDDSDFGHKPTPAKKKKTPVRKGKESAKTEKKETVSRAKTLTSSSSKAKSVSPAPSKPPAGPSSLPKAATNTTKKTVSAPSPASAPSRSPSTPASLTSSWKPPAFSNPGSSNLPVMKSPTSGLRLGLSRNQRVKSLHPSVHVT